tara:strand:+ start:774 stop:1049 length:276 start_codon:yes stop_codon:yes gene_type:complete
MHQKIEIKKIFKFIKLKLTKMRVIKKESDNSIKKINIFENDSLDSLQVLNFLTTLEKKFKVNILVSDFKKKNNQRITEICKIILKKIKKNK